MARSAVARVKKSKAATAGQGFWRFLFWAILLAIFIPILQVLATRYLDPIYTPLMLIRRVEGRLPAPVALPAYRWTDIDHVSLPFLMAVWQTEDARFFKHKGFDWVEIDHAVAEAKRSGKTVRGASTITMQCARSLFLWQGRSWIRKPIEAYYTILMETILTKRRIFELYVNVIETGDGTYGVEAAALRYWQIPARKMSPQQSAMLVAILPNPRKRTPVTPTKNVQLRAAMVAQKLSGCPRWPLVNEPSAKKQRSSARSKR